MIATETKAPALEVGAEVHFKKTITADDVRNFAALSGDYNPLHLDAEFAGKTAFGRPVAHGMLLASFVSRMVGMQLPGPGALWVRQAFQWPAPVFVGDTVELSLRITHKSEGTNTLTLEVNAVKQDGTNVMNGDGAVRLLEQQLDHDPGRLLRERVVLISGGPGNAGAAMALRLANEGAAVAINSIGNESAAADIVAAVRANAGRILTLFLDPAHPESVNEGLDSIRRTFGKPVDVLINNTVASFNPLPFTQLTWEAVQRMIDAEIRGVFQYCQAVLPAMIAQQSGCIVNIGSILTRQVPPAQWAPYVIAKSALQGLTRSLAAEFGPRGVRVNMISLSGDVESAGDRMRKVQAMQTPLRRLVAPEDIAQTIVFLCSEASAFITGADLPVAGGFSM
jgi:3-oxoacyl-[acyl-carrier protein] reductase